MSSFESKSILKIVGEYQIIGTPDDAHDSNDDILSFVYDGYFYQATVGNQDSITGTNPFSLLVEVDNFDTFQLVGLLRTKFGDNFSLLQTFTDIQPPDDFLSEVIQTGTLTFQYVDTPGGCTQPQYPNYDCSSRFDDGNYCSVETDADGNSIIVGCNQQYVNSLEVCSCDELRCIGLCGECDDGVSTNQYDCAGVWTEYCGTDEQWKCGTTDFKFYNPSPNIPYSSGCTTVPAKPEISIGVQGLTPDSNGVTDLQFNDNFSFLQVKENNPLSITITPNLDGIGQYLNKFDSVIFDVDKVYVDESNYAAFTIQPEQLDVNLLDEFSSENIPVDGEGWYGQIDSDDEDNPMYNNADTDDWRIYDGYAEINSESPSGRNIRFNVLDTIEDDVDYKLSFTIYDYQGGELIIRW